MLSLCLMQHLKGYSGHVFKKTYPKIIEEMGHDRLWTRRYHAVALPDAAAVDRAIAYVRNNPTKAGLETDQYALYPSNPTVCAVGYSEVSVGSHEGVLTI